MRSALALAGIGALALAVGGVDLSIAEAAARERVVRVRVEVLHPIPNVAACARLAHLPPPPPCTRLPCGWVINTTAYCHGGCVLYIARCEIPLS